MNLREMWEEYVTTLLQSEMHEKNAKCSIAGRSYVILNHDLVMNSTQ